MIAALYTLSSSSPYADIPGVDCWPIERNAMRYRGPGPVIIHPPCAPHSRAVSHQLIPRISQHPVLAKFAVFQVREFGGALEHPARSKLWDVMSLPYPEGYHAKAVSGPLVDRWGGWTLEVEQRDWGHRLRKRTWVYFVGVDPADVVLPPRKPDKGPNTGKIRVDERTGRTWRRAEKEPSPDDRNRTPKLFAEWLVELAAGAKRPTF